MTRSEAKKLALTVSNDDLNTMFLNAYNGISNWYQQSRVNKGMTIGATFNILTKCGLTNKTHVIAKTNMIREFGEFLPNYKKPIRNVKTITHLYHEEPIMEQINKY